MTTTINTSKKGGFVLLNQPKNHNLEQQAQALFKSWFIDYEPFRDGEFVDSELGRIPKGWKILQLGDLISINYGRDHKHLTNGDIPVYGSGGIMRYVNAAIFIGESVLVPRKGTLNNVMYVNGPFWSVDTMFYCTAKYNNCLKYVYQYLIEQDLSSMNAGSAVPSMTTIILCGLKVIYPTQNIINQFDSLLSTIFSQKALNIRQNNILVAERDILLPKLMSGEITIKD